MRGIAVVLLISALWAAPVHALDLPGWLGFSGKAAESTPIRPVVTEIVEDRGQAARSVPGVITAQNEVTMAFQTLGRMIARHVDLADRVEQGTVLAELSIEDLAAETRAEVAAVQAAEVQLTTARSTLDRTEALVSRDVATTAQLEQAQRAMAAAQAAYDQARSALIRAEALEDYARMSAPFAGVVSGVYESPGAVVGAGQPILQLSSDRHLKAEIDLPESAIEGLRDKTVFTIWRQNDPLNQIPATLDRIDPLADSATRTRRVHLSLPPDAPFRLGTLIRARLGGPGDPALTVPEIALFARDGAPHVWRVVREGETGHVEALPVTASLKLRGRVLITDGIQIGDEVVIRGVNSLQQDQPVGRRVDP